MLIILANARTAHISVQCVSWLGTVLQTSRRARSREVVSSRALGRGGNSEGRAEGPERLAQEATDVVRNGHHNERRSLGAAQRKRVGFATQ